MGACGDAPVLHRQRPPHVQLHERRASSTSCVDELVGRRPTAAKAIRVRRWRQMNAPSEFLNYGPDAILMAGLNGKNWRLTDYVARGGYEALQQDPRREDPARAGHRRGQEVGAARPRRRRLPDRAQVELHAAAATRRQVRRLQFRRGRAGHVQGPRHPALQPARGVRGHGHRRLRDGREPRLQLHPRRDLGRRTCAARRRIEEAYAAGFLGDNILGTDFSFHLYNHHGFGAYICGEETALLESLEGKKGQPRFKPPFPASFGVYGKPTTINNTETFAAVPWIINNGGEAFLEPRPARTTAAPSSSRCPATSSVRATSR